MKSIQEYLEIYRDIARKLNLQGDSIEIISQMLANATYISEVEHITYSQEASLERATLMNSKIQHCINEMYSVFRGSCPRVIIRFKSNSMFRWNVFDEIASSNSFNVYYLGYLRTEDNSTDENDKGTSTISEYSDFVYAPIIIPPTGDDVEYTIIALLSPKLIKSSWTLRDSNTYYVNLLESDLSNDIMVKVGDSHHEVTRIFSDHIKNASIFDLTLPDYGLRLYAPDIFRKSMSQKITETPANTVISAEVFKYNPLSSYNESELKQVKIKGAKLTSHLVEMTDKFGQESNTGLIFLSDISRDSMHTIHYKAARDKYMGSMVRSNADVGLILEELYPDKIVKSGTSFVFETLKSTREVIREETTTYELITPNYSSSNNNTGNSDSLISFPCELDEVTAGEASFTPKFLKTDQTFTKYLEIDKNGRIRIPKSGAGRLEILHKSNFTVENNATYELLLDKNIIFREEGSNTNIAESDFQVSIIKSEYGKVKILTKEDLIDEGLFINFDNINNSKVIFTLYEGDEKVDSKEDWVVRDVQEANIVKKPSLTNTNQDQSSSSSGNSELESSATSESSSKTTTTTVESTDSNGNKIITTTTETLNSNNDQTLQNSINNSYLDYNNGSSDQLLSLVDELVLVLSNSSIYLEVSPNGEIITPLPIKTTCSLYVSGSLIERGVVYEIISSTGVQAEIDKSGVITINSIENQIESTIIAIKATYLGSTSSVLLKIITSNSIPAFKERKLIVSDDPDSLTHLAEFDSPSGGTLSVIESDTDNKAFYLWLYGEPSIRIYSIRWVQYVNSIENYLSDPRENTKYVPKLNIYYIPHNQSTLLSQREINSFIQKNLSYYVTHDISIYRGDVVNVIMNIRLELFQNQAVGKEIDDVLKNYMNKFNLDLEGCRSEIITSIGKLSNVKCVSKLSIEYKSEIGENLDWDSIKPNLNKTYFSIKYHITSNIG